jgi:hypothetical protein
MSKDTDVVSVTAIVTVEVSFRSYSNEMFDETAKKQISTWIKEMLEEEDQIPLFIKSFSGEETLSKKVTVKI